MSRTIKTEAIVLRKLRYGEADSILTLYTREEGRLGAIAKGVRRAKSRFGGRLEPFFRLDLVLHEGRGELLTVTAADTVEAHAALRGHAQAIDAAAKAADFLMRLLDERESNPPAYNLTANLFTLLDADPDAARLETGLAYRIKLLLATGFAPEIGSCVHCGAQEGLVAFSASSGGIVCGDCRVAGDFDFSAQANRFMQAAIAAPLAQVPVAPADARRQVDRAIAETVAHHAHVRVGQLA